MSVKKRGLVVITIVFLFTLMTGICYGYETYIQCDGNQVNSGGTLEDDCTITSSQTIDVATSSTDPANNLVTYTIKGDLTLQQGVEVNFINSQLSACSTGGGGVGGAGIDFSGSGGKGGGMLCAGNTGGDTVHRSDCDNKAGGGADSSGGNVYLLIEGNLVLGEDAT
ncbi:hypothetical protein ACFLYT_01990, partial [Nanoarchaeota archaeon]